MLRRQRTETDAINAGESSRVWAIADTLWSVQDRFRSALRAAPGAIRVAVSQSVLAFREKVYWPLSDRAATMGAPARALCFGAVVLVAAGVGVAGLIWAAPDRPDSPMAAQTATETAPPLATVKASPATPKGPTLHGVAPVFKPAAAGRASSVDSAKPIETASSDSSSSSSDSSSTAASSGSPSGAASTSDAKSPDTPGPPAGPAAISVARDFAGAFVLYETGHTDSDVRKSFSESATPELSRSLLRRPPSLPANVTVPKAKVVNVVAAPSHGRVYPLSVSLLRVGVTSELRLEMERLKDKSWQVTNVLG
jgi:hypothetical protein